ncbi:MAG: hypothetical protein QME79_00885 [Bacillota bacterium]|nr:hypothetical protein [Bacillota bacterium]
MAERDRRRERRLRYLEEELRYCRERARYYTERAEQLERERAELTAEDNPPAGGEGGGGGLAELAKALNPETLKQISEAVQGLDLQPLLAALGGAGSAGAPGAAEGVRGGGGPPLAALGGLLGFGGRGPVPGGSALDGLAEVMGYLEKNPLKGRRWTFKDALGLLQLVRSPNVRALLASATAVASLVRAGSKAAPLLSSLLGGGGTGRGGGGKPQAAAAEPPQPEKPTPSEPPRLIRFSRTEGPPPVVEPWREDTPGRWVWVAESGETA